MRALVIGDDTRSFLAIVRSLGRAGWSVDAAPFDFSSPALSSRYVRKVHRIDPYPLDAERWSTRVASLAAQHEYDLIVPCDDRALIPLARHATALAPTRLALPNQRSIDTFFDKLETRKLAMSLGLAVAPGRPIGVTDTAQDLVAEFGLPIVLKPRSSYILGRSGPKLSVRIARDMAQADAAFMTIADRTGWLVEGFFAGEGCGLSVLADRGEIVMAFQHRRLAEASESGGSSVRIGEEVDPDLMSTVAALARATMLHGVAMFEFRRDRGARRCVLLEVNCRFWGSLPLAISSGVDFPAAAARLYLGDPPPPCPGYLPGVMRRDLGGEYNRIMITASDHRTTTGKVVAAAIGSIGLAPALIRGGKNDSFAADDPEPFRRERKQLARHVVAALTKRLSPSAFRYARGRAAVRELRERRQVRHAGTNDGGIVMLCHGNICRSPFAALRLIEKARAADLGLSVLSVGSFEAEGRGSPDEAIDAARPWGIDLSAHRSRFIDAETARRSDAVIVFDDRNVDEVRRLGIAGDVNLLRLADLIGQRVIEDPYGRGRECFDRVYAQIDAALDRLVSDLAGTGKVARP